MTDHRLFIVMAICLVIIAAAAIKALLR